MLSRARSAIRQVVGQVSDLPVSKSVGQVSDLPVLKFIRGTRPRPFLHALNQPRTHGVSFDVVNDTLKFPVVAHPMVMGFILPKRPSGSAKNDIRLTGARAFYSSGYLVHRFVRLRQNVYVVRHQHPSEEVAKFPMLVSGEQRPDHTGRYLWVYQPGWSRNRPIQFPVEQRKRRAFRGGNGTDTHVTGARQSAVKPPGQKDWNTFRLPMRQSTTIEADNETVVIIIDNSHDGRSETCPT
jgi:hypothetical protein